MNPASIIIWIIIYEPEFYKATFLWTTLLFPCVSGISTPFISVKVFISYHVSYHTPFWVTLSGGTVRCQDDNLLYHQWQSTAVVLAFNFQSYFQNFEFDLWNYSAVIQLCIVYGIMTLFSTWIHALCIKQNELKKVFLWKYKNINKMLSMLDISSVMLDISSVRHIEQMKLLFKWMTKISKFGMRLLNLDW